MGGGAQGTPWGVAKVLRVMRVLRIVRFLRDVGGSASHGTTRCAAEGDGSCGHKLSGRDALRRAND